MNDRLFSIGVETVMPMYSCAFEGCHNATPIYNAVTNIINVIA